MVVFSSSARLPRGTTGRSVYSAADAAPPALSDTGRCRPCCPLFPVGLESAGRGLQPLQATKRVATNRTRVNRFTINVSPSTAHESVESSTNGGSLRERSHWLLSGRFLAGSLRAKNTGAAAGRRVLDVNSNRLSAQLPTGSRRKHLTRPAAATNVGRASQPVAGTLTAWEGRPITCAYRARSLRAKSLMPRAHAAAVIDGHWSCRYVRGHSNPDAQQGPREPVRGTPPIVAIGLVSTSSSPRVSEGDSDVTATS